MTGDKFRIEHHAENLALQSILRLAMLFPYKVRIPLVGWIAANVVGPVAGWNKRVRDNLALVAPDMPKADVERIKRAVANNVGRTLIEIYSGAEFVTRVRDTQLTGPGVTALEKVLGQNRPLILVTGHIGNYDVIRAALSARDVQIAALYKPMSNKIFNAHYLKAISAIGEPVYSTDGRGVTRLVLHLRNGGTIGVVADVASTKSPPLTFFGQEALTATSAAEWALKYDALIIPIFALRQKNGLDFKIHVAEPIAHDAPEKMMQSYNDILEALVRENMDQWFWIHRRWKRVIRRS